MIKFRFIRIDKIILAFVLPFFCLLISVSNAFEIMPNVTYTKYISELVPKVDTDIVLDEDFITIVSNYYNEPVDYLSDFENVIKNLLSVTGKSNFYISSYGTSSFDTFDLLLFNDDDWAYHLASGDLGMTNIIAYLTKNSTVYYAHFSNNYTSATLKSLTAGSSYDFYKGVSLYNYVYYLSSDVKNFNASQSMWNGITYLTSNFELSAPDNPDTPSFPSNAEITQAVQNFYNSDYYKNNKDFKEFFVLYNSLKGIYSFIGHNSVGEIANHFKYGSTLSQHIYTENYPSNTTGLRYWNFSLETLSSQISNFFNNYYWLYSSYDNGISFAYNGKGYITDLIDVKFDSRYSTIVYSSTDYLCRVYDYENDEETTIDSTIPGDQYTYDENLDPTTNEYNPIQDFVPTSPSQTILGDVDFDEINKTFEENKDILNIEGASWLFTANNKLVGYFIGFLSLLIVFLIISRILGG